MQLSFSLLVFCQDHNTCLLPTWTDASLTKVNSVSSLSMKVSSSTIFSSRGSCSAWYMKCFHTLSLPSLTYLVIMGIASAGGSDLALYSMLYIFVMESCYICIKIIHLSNICYLCLHSYFYNKESVLALWTTGLVSYPTCRRLIANRGLPWCRMCVVDTSSGLPSGL